MYNFRPILLNIVGGGRFWTPKHNFSPNFTPTRSQDPQFSPNLPHARPDPTCFHPTRFIDFQDPTYLGFDPDTFLGFLRHPRVSWIDPTRLFSPLVIGIKE